MISIKYILEARYKDVIAKKDAEINQLKKLNKDLAKNNESLLYENGDLNKQLDQAKALLREWISSTVNSHKFERTQSFLNEGGKDERNKV